MANSPDGSRPSPGVFGTVDAVLDAGVGTVPGLIPLQGTDLGVREDRGVAPAVAFLEQRYIRGTNAARGHRSNRPKIARSILCAYDPKAS